jgi:mRNA interferase MazF
VRGDVYRLEFRGSGHEQRGVRYAIDVQDVRLNLSTVVVVPTTGNLDLERDWRPRIAIDGDPCIVKCEAIQSVDRSTLGARCAQLDEDDLEAIDTAIRLVLVLPS